MTLTADRARHLVAAAEARLELAQRRADRIDAADPSNVEDVDRVAAYAALEARRDELAEARAKLAVATVAAPRQDDHAGRRRRDTDD